MRRLVCAFVGHRPEARFAAGVHSIQEWTRCSRCLTILSKPTRSAKKNRAMRRSGRML